MSYVKKTSHSVGTPSIYSHMTTTRSSANLRATRSRSRSVKSLKTPWYQKPLVQDAIFFDVQQASMIIVIYSIMLSIFTAITAVFDMYCLSMAVPGSIHQGFYFFSYDFVYIGNKYVRKVLIFFAMFSFIYAIVLLVTGTIAILGLRKEHEGRVIPWLIVFGTFTIFRMLAILFFGIVSDIIFTYNILMCMLWTLFTALNIYGWMVVYSLYLELQNLTKLEDLAHLRMGTMQSLNASTTHSLAGSRPTTPHSIISTTPMH